MLRNLGIIFILLVSIFVPFFQNNATPVQAASENLTQDPDAALCLPGTDSMDIGDCLQAGPDARLKELASQGITFPEKPIVAGKTPRDLAIVPFQYGIVTPEETPLYDSLESITNKEPSSLLPAGKIKYVSLKNSAETPQGVYYQIATSKWVSAEYVRKVGVQNFQGFVFKQNPDFIFGWVINNDTVARSAPGYAAPETGRIFSRFEIIRAYDAQVVNDVEWVMVGVDEWIEHRNVARVIPNYTRPEGVTVDRWIEVNLYEQVISVYEDGNLLFATLISTGVDPFFTQPGVFQVYKKLEHDPMSGAFELDKSDYYYLEDVPYILYYDQLRALHGAYWHSLLGYQRSHGCVNLSIADAHWLYDWANVGDYVHVIDPSGKTPTDPAFYGAGGV